MSPRIISGLLVLGLLTTIMRPVRAEVTAEDVRNSINRGVAFLKSRQNARGNWAPYGAFPGGVTALCTLALLNSGVDKKDPAIQKSLRFLRNIKDADRTYVVALQTMVFCLAEPENHIQIRQNVKWLQDAQLKAGPRKGSWTYLRSSTRGDNSNTQFALLALHEAQRVGVDVSPQTWRLALAYWLDPKHQHADGAWGYFPGQPARASMTCAGIASVIIASENLPEYRSGARIVDGRVQCCGKEPEGDAVERALQWMGEHYSVDTNPGAVRGGDSGHLLYYLYALERAGRLTGRRFIHGTKGEKHDWYRDGADFLVKRQDPLNGYWKGVGPVEGNNPDVGTALALLFLSKGRRPVLMARLKHGQLGADPDDWRQHRKGVHRLTRYVEKKWRRDMTWQTIDIRGASVEDLLETPVLFISGRGKFRLTEQQQKNLVEYVNRGGFIFAEACHGDGCDGEAFEESFTKLMQDLFNSEFQTLPPEHIIWYAEEKVDPSPKRVLKGISACCRTSIVYCPNTLSCYWELGGGSGKPEFPEAVQYDIDQANAIGVNVLAYATNRKLREKLQPKTIATGGGEKNLDRGVLSVPKLRHDGGSDEASNALTNVLDRVHKRTRIRISTRKHLLSPADERLLEFPLAFMHGLRSFAFSDQERAALKTYLERGGMLFADSVCSSPQFSESFRAELAKMFPDARLTRISTDHPLFTPEFRGFDIRRVTLRNPQRRVAGERISAREETIAPLLEGLEIDGRLAVIFSPYDISCAMENQSSLECKGYKKEDAERICVNVFLYALQQ